MSLATLLESPATAPRCRGRRRVADDPAQRQIHIRCATLRLVHGLSVEETARALDCSPRTVQLQTLRALEYPEAADLRLYLAGRQPTRN